MAGKLPINQCLTDKFGRQIHLGLTEKQSQRLRRKTDKAIADGMSKKMAAKMRAGDALRTRLVRAAAIARTETNDAMTFSLTESWSKATDEGLMPKGTKKKWVAFIDEERTSDECKDLDGEEVGLNDDFSTSEGEGFTGPRPPAHRWHTRLSWATTSLPTTPAPRAVTL